MQADYENLNENSVSIINENQINDSTISKINLNEDKMIIKEENNPELEETDSKTKDDMEQMKIEKDNFLDENNNNNNQNNQMEKGNLNYFAKNRIISRRRFGKTYPFLFTNGEPMIVIGPHCMPIFIFIYILMFFLAKKKPKNPFFKIFFAKKFIFNFILSFIFRDLFFISRKFYYCNVIYFLQNF